MSSVSWSILKLHKMEFYPMHTHKKKRDDVNYLGLLDWYAKKPVSAKHDQESAVKRKKEKQPVKTELNDFFSIFPASSSMREKNTFLIQKSTLPTTTSILFAQQIECFYTFSQVLLDGFVFISCAGWCNRCLSVRQTKVGCNEKETWNRKASDPLVRKDAFLLSAGWGADKLVLEHTAGEAQIFPFISWALRTEWMSLGTFWMAEQKCVM